jgi:hypothetical protein
MCWNCSTPVRRGSVILMRCEFHSAHTCVIVRGSLLPHPMWILLINQLSPVSSVALSLVGV